MADWPLRGRWGKQTLGRSLLVLDFDGTVCLGDGAVYAYARELAIHPGGDRVEADLARFFEDPDGDPRLADADDGYQAVWKLAALAGISDDHRNVAYRASREKLDAAALHTPPGLIDLLEELDVRRVLCTNAPGHRLEPLLEALGLRDVIDYVLPDARKPSLMSMHLSKLLDAAGLADHPEQLMSVGDIWHNDIEAALELGCATAYVDTYDRRRGPAHVRAATLPEVYDDLRAWASDPQAFVRTRPVGSADATAVLDSTPTGPGQP